MPDRLYLGTAFMICHLILFNTPYYVPRAVALGTTWDMPCCYQPHFVDEETEGDENEGTG